MRKNHWQKHRPVSQTQQINIEKQSFYNIRDKIWLSTKNINTNQLSKKLDHKIIDPFEIIG